MLRPLQMTSVQVFQHPDSPGRTRACSWTLWTTSWRYEVSIGTDVDSIAIHLQSYFSISRRPQSTSNDQFTKRSEFRPYASRPASGRDMDGD